MAGVMAGKLIGLKRGELTPEEVAGNPYFRDTNPLLDLLVAFLRQTEAPGRRTPAQPSPTPTPVSSSVKMRQTKGPIKARTAHRIAGERDRVMRELEGY